MSDSGAVVDRDVLLELVTDVVDRGQHAAIVEQLRVSGQQPLDYDQLGERTRRIRHRQAYAQVSAVYDALVPLLADSIIGLCDWNANRFNARGDCPLHEEFHLGFGCPYEATAAILRGEPDPRHPDAKEHEHG